MCAGPRALDLMPSHLTSTSSEIPTVSESGRELQSLGAHRSLCVMGAHEGALWVSV